MSCSNITRGMKLLMFCLAAALVVLSGTGCSKDNSRSVQGDPKGNTAQFKGVDTYDTGTDWKWMNPKPHGNELLSIWACSANDIYAVGRQGIIMHYNGSKWSVMDSGTTAPLFGIWGSSANDIFAVGQSIILHYNGSVWQPMSLPSNTYASLQGVWGSAGNDVFAVGYLGVILHYDGGSWSVMDSGVTSGILFSVWGISGSDVFVGGTDGRILHYDGHTWTVMMSGNGTSYYGIWGSSKDDVFAVGVGSNSIMHYNGTKWEAMISGSYLFYGVWGATGQDVYAAGWQGHMFHYDGSGWSPMASGTYQQINSLCGSSSSNIFAVGQGGILLHHNMNAWSTMNEDSIDVFCLYDAWGSSGTDIYAVGSGNSSSPSIIEGTILHYDGILWSTVDYNGEVYLKSVWGAGPDDVYAAGIGGIEHYDGHSWTIMDTPSSNYVNGIWGSSGSDVFFVGEYGDIAHYNGTIWSSMIRGAADKASLNRVWGSAPDDVFAVGDSGTILRYDGSAWSPMISGTTNDLLDVWGSAPDDVFAVGDGGTILHFDGSSWSTMTGGAGIRIMTVWGSAWNDVYAMNGYKVLHYDGSTWSAVDSGTSTTIYRMWGGSEDDIFAVGYGGAILHYGGGSPAVSGFSASPTSGAAPLTVNFTGQYTGTATDWSWDFGDGGTATDQNPSHIYTSAGTYTVSLTINGSEGTHTSTRTSYITVSAPAIIPVISYACSAQNNSCTQGADAPGQSFQVWNSGTGILSYTVSSDKTWLACSPQIGSSTDSGDKKTIAMNFSTSSLAAGTYQATITIAAAGAANSPLSFTINLTVNNENQTQPPAADPNQNPTPNPATYALNVSVAGGHGTLTISPSAATYAQGTIVNLTAKPDAGYQVKAWAGTDNDASKSITNSVTMSAARNVTVEFEPVPVTADDAGSDDSGDGDGGGGGGGGCFISTAAWDTAGSSMPCLLLLMLLCIGFIKIAGSRRKLT